ncbi:hypothetical protein ANN_03319 [Periplaneta americana]|uniref:HTH psq-type domain-containing protein n=1 Tax=Periplaneta americana TaxID=6978 RepID=A0ABQ8TYM4_PERAM|nr:hypothetical protein ANN_03319 [Periplaneta americana]
MHRSIMPAIKGHFRNYTEETMREAINDVRTNNTPIRTAAKKYGVPRITLKYKVEGKSPIEKNGTPNHPKS